MYVNSGNCSVNGTFNLQIYKSSWERWTIHVVKFHVWWHSYWGMYSLWSFGLPNVCNCSLLIGIPGNELTCEQQCSPVSVLPPNWDLLAHCSRGPCTGLEGGVICGRGGRTTCLIFITGNLKQRTLSAGIWDVLIAFMQSITLSHCLQKEVWHQTIIDFFAALPQLGMVAQNNMKYN